MKTDRYDGLDRAIDGKLDGMELDWDRRTALGVVMAAHNYPDTPRKGDVITGIPKETEDSVTFHAGTTLNDGVLTTNGGRVLCVVGLADTVKAAQRAAYGAIEQIQFDGAQYRTDIGHRAIRH